MPDGNPPVSWFKSTCSDSNWVSTVMVEGIPPLSALFVSSRDTSAVHALRVLGSVPTSWLLDRSSTCSVVSALTVDAILPARLVLDRFNPLRSHRGKHGQRVSSTTVPILPTGPTQRNTAVTAPPPAIAVTQQVPHSRATPNIKVRANTTVTLPRTHCTVITRTHPNVHDVIRGR